MLKQFCAAYNAQQPYQQLQVREQMNQFFNIVKHAAGDAKSSAKKKDVVYFDQLLAMVEKK